MRSPSLTKGNSAATISNRNTHKKPQFQPQSYNKSISSGIQLNSIQSKDFDFVADDTLQTRNYKYRQNLNNQNSGSRSSKSPGSQKQAYYKDMGIHELKHKMKQNYKFNMLGGGRSRV